MTRVFLVLAALAASHPAAAQSLGQLGGLGGGLGGLGGGVPSVGSASLGNVSGLLTYCVKHKYLNGGAVGAVQNGLTKKLGGPARQERDPGFLQGSGGSLQTGGGQGFALGGGGLKEQLTNKLCDQVLNRAKSLL